MKAIVVPAPGGPEVLRFEDIPEPIPGSDEILISVKACGVNRADTVQRRGQYPPPPGHIDIMGLEVSGIVEASGSRVKDWVPGDKVFALLSSGGYAEKVVVRQDQVIRLPDYLSFIEGAAIAEVYLTAYRNLFDVGGLKKGETVLIHAGASGVGTAAIQLAKRIGCKVITTVGSSEKEKVCAELGADLVLNYKQGEFASKVLESTNNKGVDLIFDLVGAAHWEQNQRVLCWGGRIVIIGVSGGTEIKADLRVIMRNNWKILGSTLRTQSLEYKSDLIKRFWEDCHTSFQNKELKPVINCTFKLQEAAQAHRYIESNKNIGKIILEVK